MSYSFTVRAADKNEAVEKLSAEYDNIVNSQPVHSVDREQAQAAVEAFINLVREDEKQDILVSVSGSCWSVEQGLNSVGLNISTSLVPKAAGTVTQPLSQ
jgi:hypothetical protein